MSVAVAVAVAVAIVDNQDESVEDTRLGYYSFEMGCVAKTGCIEIEDILVLAHEAVLGLASDNCKYCHYWT